MVRTATGLKGTEAVIDKDMCAALLASEVRRPSTGYGSAYTALYDLSPIVLLARSSIM